MASYRKIFNGEGYISANTQEGTKAEAKAEQKKKQALGYKTRIVKTKNGFSGKTGYTLFIRKA